jgi:hypothetical protein
MIPNSPEDQILIQINELKTMLSSTEDQEMIERILLLIKKLTRINAEQKENKKPEVKSIDRLSDGVFVKQLGQALGGQKPEVKKKSKVRVAIPAGSKGKFKDGKSSSSELVVPPGKIKFTGVSEDGQLEAELVSQMSASDYMKAIEDTARGIEKNTGNKKTASAAKQRADKARKERKNILLSSGTSNSQSEIGKMTLEKSESIIEAAKDAGLSMFTPEYVKYNEKRIPIQEYYSNYEFNLKESIKEIKTDIRTKVFEDIDLKVRKLISSSSENEIRLAVKAVALLIHQDIDRRARVSMTKSSLEDFLDNGTILNINVNSQSLELLKKQRDRRLGNKREISRFSLVPVELMHGTFVRKTEEMLYSYGTRVGSEEFTDSGRGIEIVLRAENAPRIGYGKKNSYEDGGVFSFITEEDERIIELAIFGGDGNISQSGLIEILDAYISGDPSSLLVRNDDDSIEAFIVGEISLNDIEHIKIPLSIFNIRKKKVSNGNRIGGQSRLTLMMRSRKLSEDKIRDFFEKDGTIGGGYTPKYLSYLLEYEAAIELKKRLVSFGVQDVVFTNREGIDIMSENTWQTPGPKKKYGLDALKEIAKKEIESIIDKYAPKPVLKKLPKKKEGQ